MANGVSCEGEHRLYKRVLYFQNVRVSQYMRKYNLICVHKKSTAFPALIFAKIFKPKNICRALI